MIAELMRQREVLGTLVDKDFRSRYKAKALGRLWSIADPLVMITIYTVVFVHILKVAEPFYPIFLLLALTPYRFFSNSVNGAASAVSDNVQLVKKVSFPRLWLPLVFAVQLAGICGIALSVAALNVRYRDTQYILNSALLILYWLTPIFYAFRSVPPSIGRLLMWNPLVGVVEGYRSVLMHGAPPSPSLLGAAGLSSLAFLAVGVYLFQHFQNVFADYI
jgi:lipopolysaccharide transport system permease protein